jgi:hypothetical protein
VSKALEIAQRLSDGAERARQNGDIAASLDLAIGAALYLQLARAFDASSKAHIYTGEREALQIGVITDSRVV